MSDAAQQLTPQAYLELSKKVFAVKAALCED